MLVPLKTILKAAERGRWAIGAFNTANLELTLGIVRGAVVARAPVIIQVTEGSIRYAGLKPLTHIVETVAKNEAGDLPVALHFDHGTSFHPVVECIRAGFSSIHLDASQLPLDENIALTRQAADYAHRFGVLAQGELGRIIGKEGDTRLTVPADADYLTDPKQAAHFVRATGIDTLAVSVGSKHGRFPGRERLDLKRLAAIRARVKVPFVLHGSSGVPAADIRRAVRLGVRIINVDTALRIAFTTAVKRGLARPSTSYDPRRYLSPAIDAVARVVADYCRLTGAAGKARTLKR